MLASACSSPEREDRAAEIRELVRVEVAEFAAWRMKGSGEATETLAAHLRSPFPSVRATAARALGRSAEEGQAGALANLLTLESDPVVRRETVVALGKLRGHEVPKALKAAASDTDPLIRAAAAHSLGYRGGSAVGPLLTLLRDAEPEVRRQAALALVRRPALDADAELEALEAAEPDEAVRWAVVKAVAVRPRLAAKLQNRLAAGVLDANFLVSVFALEVLPALGGGVGLEETLTLVGDPERFWQARLAGVEALREWWRRPGLSRRRREAIESCFAAVASSAEAAGLHPPLRRAILQGVEANAGGRSLLEGWKRTLGSGRPPEVKSVPGHLVGKGLAAVDSVTPYRYRPAAAFLGKRNPRLHLEFGGLGELVVELYPGDAPHHVSAFLDMVERGSLEGETPRWVHGTLGVAFQPGADGEATVRFALPPEPSRRAIRHGTLFEPPGGRRGGGFVIAFLPLPELEGRVTVLGKVVLGTRLLSHLRQGSRLDHAISLYDNDLTDFSEPKTTKFRR